MSHHRATKSVSESSSAQSAINSANMHPSNTISRPSTYHGTSGHMVFFDEESGEMNESAILDGAEEDYAPKANPVTPLKKAQMKDIGINTVEPHPLDVAIQTRAPVIVNIDGTIIPATTEVKDFANVERLSTHDWIIYTNRSRKIFINLRDLDGGRRAHKAKVAEMEAIFNSQNARTTPFQRALAFVTAAEAMTMLQPNLYKFDPLGPEAETVRKFHSYWENGTYLIVQFRDSQPHRDDLPFLNYAHHVLYDLRHQWIAFFRAIDAVTGPNEKKLAPPQPATVGSAPAEVDIPGHKFMKVVRKARKAFEKGLGQALDKGKALTDGVGKAFDKGKALSEGIGEALGKGKRLSKGKGKVREV